MRCRSRKRRESAAGPAGVPAAAAGFRLRGGCAVTAETLLRAVRGADRALIASAALFDVYEGEHVPAGKKSLAVEVVIQPREATLTDAAIEALAAKVVEAAAKATGAVLRG